jgi:hypothetical protein
MSNVPRDDVVTVIRSEERLNASTIARPVQRAVLRKVIVTEERTITVTLRHEEFRLDYEPIEAGSAAPVPIPMPLDLVLHEEQLTMTTTAVPTERIRIAVQQVVEEQVVTGAVRLERVDLDGLPQPEVGSTAQPRHRV